MRAAELGASLPDPILLVQALGRVMAKLLQQQAQAAFRISTYRLQHGIDIRPSRDGVESFHELLLAEAELMVGATPQDGSQVSKPVIKVMATSSTPSAREHPSGTSICRWWGSEHGCRAARNCKFHHPQLEDKAERRWLCSGKGHRKAYSGGSEAVGAGHQHGHQHSQQKDGKDREASAGKGKGKKGSGKGSTAKGAGKPAKEEGLENPGGQSVTPTAEAAPAKAVTEGLATSAVRSAAVDDGTGELVSEVTSLLRSMRIGGAPSIRACYIRSFGEAMDGSVLLDRGATHCLRQARDDHEWNESRSITVQQPPARSSFVSTRKVGWC